MTNWNKIFALRDQVLTKLEILRTNKKIGAPHEAGVILTFPTFGEGIFNSNLLRTVFKVSWVNCLIDDRLQATDIKVWSLVGDDQFIQCGRCWNFHKDYHNFDRLCDRCGRVLCTAYPDHWSVPGLRASLAYQNTLRAGPATDFLRVKPAYTRIELGGRPFSVVNEGNYINKVMKAYGKYNP